MECSQVLEDSMVIKLNAIVFFWNSRSVPKEIYLQNFSYIINRIRDVWVMGTAKCSLSCPGQSHTAVGVAVKALVVISRNIGM